MTIPIRKLTDLILYSSLWISLCAAALVLFTYDVTRSGLRIDALTGFVFCGTLALYAIHRISGIERVRQYEDQGRFAVIRKYRSHILLYGAIGALGAAVFVFLLPWSTMRWLILPCLISLFYVIPVGGKKRLRDIPWIKIFLIAAVWSVLTGVIPFVHATDAAVPDILLLFAERATFVFGITVPFDIRDMDADRTSGVRTLPHDLGVGGSKLLALAVLLVSAGCTWLLITGEVYDAALTLPYLLTWIVTAALIWFSKPGADDYYFSGLVDGTMFLLPFLYWLWGVVPLSL